VVQVLQGKVTLAEMDTQMAVIGLQAAVVAALHPQVLLPLSALAGKVEQDYKIQSAEALFFMRAAAAALVINHHQQVVAREAVVMAVLTT